MTTGEKLQKELGLTNVRPRISRLINIPLKMYYVYYDSHTPKKPIHWRRVAKDPRISRMLQDGDDILMTPLLDLKDFNGKSRSAYYILVDLAGDAKAKLIESVTLDDLKNSMSALTTKFRKQRNKSTGTENRLAKLLEVEYLSGGLTFKWLTTPTDDPKNPNRNIFNADPSTGALKIDPSKTYEMHIKILDFKEWLDTYPEGYEIKAKDLKEILEVAYVQVWSSDPSYHWQGMAYRLTNVDGAIYPVDIPDSQWVNLHGSKGLLTKHLIGLIRSMPFWLNPMATMATKLLKNKGLL